jgi:hypothetical protein
MSKPINEMSLEELAEYAVTLEGWEWMPGMLGYRGGSVWVRITFACNGPRLTRPERAIRPDLEDPATLGCVLAMVRKKRAYLVIECRLISDMPNEPNSRPYYRAVSTFGSESWMVHTDWMQTEAHALIAVLAKEDA